MRAASTATREMSGEHHQRQDGPPSRGEAIDDEAPHGSRGAQPDHVGRLSAVFAHWRSAVENETRVVVLQLVQSRLGAAGVKKKKPLSKRAKASLRYIRRDPFGRLTLEIGRYLDTVGWSAFVIGRARVQQQPGARMLNYEFVVDFTGRKKKAKS